MTQQQREKLFRIVGKIEGLAYAVEEPEIADGFLDIVEDLTAFLKEDNKDETC